MFSSYIQSFFNQLQFFVQILKRFLVILFRKRKEIRLLHLEYCDKHLFRSSIITINYRFRNAIYYKFGNHITLENHIKLFNLDKIQPELNLTVYGFFRKEQYVLKLQPEKILIKKSFKTAFSNLNAEMITKTLPISFLNDFTPVTKKARIRLSNILFEIKPIQAKHDSFNQTDFL